MPPTIININDYFVSYKWGGGSNILVVTVPNELKTPSLLHQEEVVDDIILLVMHLSKWKFHKVS